MTAADEPLSIQALFNTLDGRRIQREAEFLTDDGEQIVISVSYPRGAGLDAMKAMALMGSKKSLIAFLAGCVKQHDQAVIDFLAGLGVSETEIEDRAIEAFADGPMKLEDAGTFSI